jgi:hypothetical protein
MLLENTPELEKDLLIYIKKLHNLEPTDEPTIFRL